MTNYDESTWKTPKLTIGGIDVPAQGFTWALTAGVTPYMTSFKITERSINEQLLTLQNPITIQLVVTGGINGKGEELALDFSNVYLLDPKTIDPYHTVWTMADCRWSWRGKKIYGCWNKTKLKNEKGLAINVDNSDPQIIRQQFDTFRNGRYIPWSMRGGEATWSQYEILLDVFNQLGIAYVNNATGQRGAYYLENVIMDGVDIYQGLAKLLADSRLNLGIDKQGNVYVYSLDFFDEAELNLTEKFANVKRTKPGIFWKQDLRKTRPSNYKIRFKKLQETWVVSHTGANLPEAGGIEGLREGLQLMNGLRVQEDIDNFRVLNCVNVMPIPYPVSHNGRNYNIGEWIPIVSYLNIVGISEADIRNYYFASVMERRYANQIEIATGAAPSQANEQYAHQIISAIKAHYRRTYRIDSYYTDRMAYWEPRRCTVINNYDHYAPVSPVFVDCCFLPYLRHPLVAKRTASWNTDAYNWEINTNDARREKPTGASLSVVSQEYGIFSIDFPRPIEFALDRIFPFALDPLPYRSLSGSAYNLQRCHLKDTHHLEAIISIEWQTGTDSKFNGNKKYYDLNFNFNNPGQGPPLEYISNLDYARMPVRGLVTELPGAGGVIPAVDPDVPVNKSMLDGLAVAEAAKLSNQYKDRYSGYVTFAGFVDTNLAGTIKSIAYSFSPSSGLETIVDAREMPPAPTIEQQVSQEMLAYLKHQITNASTSSEIKK